MSVFHEMMECSWMQISSLLKRGVYCMHCVKSCSSPQFGLAGASNCTETESIVVREVMLFAARGVCLSVCHVRI